MSNTSFHDLVPVQPREISGATVQTANARQLHAALEVGRDFSNWIKGRIDRFGFVEGQDYLLAKTGEQLPSGTKWLTEYHITLDMAKELAMVENNERGREVRRYFIACERMVKEMLGANGITPQVLGGIVKGVVNKAIEDAMRNRLPEMVGAALLADPRHAAVTDVSQRQLIERANVPSKGRNRLNRKFSYWLPRYAIAAGVLPKVCPHSGVMLYPVDMAEAFMRERGNGWIADHNARVTGPSVTTRHGVTAVFLDPPYGDDERHEGVYSHDSMTVAADVRAWAIESGNDPLMRIALCGYDGEHAMPDDWECLEWKARGGYGSQGDGEGRANASRERIWFSPHCLKITQHKQLSLLGGAA